MKRKFHIENLQIRLKNVAPERVRDIGRNLGGEILRHLAGDKTGKIGAQKIGRLDGGTIKNNGGAADLQSRIAERIAALIGERND